MKPIFVVLQILILLQVVLGFYTMEPNIVVLQILILLQGVLGFYIITSGSSIDQEEGYIYTDAEKEADIVAKIKTRDSNFNSGIFKYYAQRCVLDIYAHFNRCEIQELMSLESAELFNIHKSDIEQSIINKKLNCTVLEEIEIIKITKYKIDGNKEVIGCKAHFIYQNATIDPVSNSVLKYDVNMKSNYMYIEFMKNKNVKHNNFFALNQCPNCGALIEVNAQGICIYCDSTLINGEHSWVLNKVEPFIDKM